MKTPFGEVTESAKNVLETFLKVRPNVQLPPHLEKLQGTHGFYVGDGREEREIKLGWKPSFVVFINPGWPDGAPQPTKDGGYLRPDLHEQPLYTDSGFKVTKTFNEPGQLSLYVAWKSA